MKRLDDKDKLQLEKRYGLPDQPHIIVHPSRTAKSGKFDCTVMSISLLLDYRPEDTKEHSFEVSLFAELFNEMLARDFGFNIYKVLCELPEKPKEKDEKRKKVLAGVGVDGGDNDDKKRDDERKRDDEKKRTDDEKKKDEKKNEEEKKKDEKKRDDERRREDDRKKDDEKAKCDEKKKDDERKRDEKRREKIDWKEENSRCGSNKKEDRRREVGRKEERRLELGDSDDDDAVGGGDDSEDTSSDRKSRSRDKRKHDKVKMVTKDRSLLLSFIYFDQTHCGYIFEKDIEELLYTLGLSLSRAQVRKLSAKVITRDSLHYRKLTDAPVEEVLAALGTTANGGSAVLPLDMKQLAAGNKRLLAIPRDITHKDEVPRSTDGELMHMQLL